MKRLTCLAVVLGTLAWVLGCGGNSAPGQMPAAPAAESTTPAAAPAAAPAGDPVSGTIMGTSVNLIHAEFDGELALYEGDGWGFSPSLMIFLFLDEGESVEGKTFSVSSSSNDFSAPHVHYRWYTGEEDNIETDIASSEYDMELTFGTVDGIFLPGTITFSIPGKDTSVKGSFRAEMRD